MDFYNGFKARIVGTVLIKHVYRIPMLSDDFSVALATVVAAVIPLSLALIVYWKGQVTQRQRVLFELIKELNESKDLILAKELLGYDQVKKQNGAWFHSYNTVTVKELKFLKAPSSRKLEDQSELEIKNSLDSFIVFLGKVGYSLKVGAIKKHEIIYFKYWIDQTLYHKEVPAYINHPSNEFPLYQMLIKEMAKSEAFGRFRKWARYQQEAELPTEPEQATLLEKLRPRQPSGEATPPTA